MPRPRIHSDAAERNRLGQAAWRARQKSLTPMERRQPGFAYTVEELAAVEVLKDRIAEVERLAADLHAKLRARLPAEDVPEHTQIRLPTW